MPEQSLDPRHPESQTLAADAAGPALSDPRTRYPRPPFKHQAQDWPGLASRMEPRPDHGETSYVGSGRLHGRKVLVTGGDSGMGRAAAIAFAREGADVAIGYLPEEEEDAREVIDLITQAGRKGVALPGDIRTEAVCRQLVADAVAQLGGLDILVNNAAFQHAVPQIEDLSSEQFERTFKTNVYAPFWITKAALQHLPVGAAIINTASIQAYESSQSLLDYAQSKACNVAFTHALARQLAERGIRVNAVAPGPVWTPLQPAGGQRPDALPQFGAQTPLGRPGQPVELAGVYVNLAASDSAYTTGEIHGVAGGSGRT